MKWVGVAVVMFLMMAGSIMLVDYFADGCTVEGRALKEVRPGLQVWVRGESCHQIIIHTERGRKRDTGGRVRF